MKSAKQESAQSHQDLAKERYTIQLGSFTQKEKAYALKNKLKKEGLVARVSERVLNGKGTWYRVRMGSFSTPEEAQQWVENLGDLSPPPFITSSPD